MAGAPWHHPWVPPAPAALSGEEAAFKEHWGCFGGITPRCWEHKGPLAKAAPAWSQCGAAEVSEEGGHRWAGWEAGLAFRSAFWPGEEIAAWAFALKGKAERFHQK